MRQYLHISTIIITVALLLACSNGKTVEQTYLESVENIRETWAPDSRVAVFDLDLKRESGTWVVSGETSSHEAWEELMVLSNRLLPEMHRFDVKRLPHAELGDSVYAMARISVANLRRNPGHTHELVDQVILGTRLKLMKRQGGWYYAQTPYGYLGWITGASLAIHDHKGIKKWKRSDLRQIGTTVSFIRENPDETSRVVNDATMGGTVKLLKEERRYSSVELPDGRRGYIPTAHLTAHVEPGIWHAPDGSKIVETAMKLHGIPYLWGGNSTKGFDCSGFTQTVYRAHAYQLPRDASQQVNTGEVIEADENFTNLEPGDLIFFGPENRITHVGISLGGPQFIHASAYVEINSLREGDPDFAPDRRRTVRYVKRITDVRE
ncbi:MAG: NlpC/P60 family protein [Rhodothermaceae bacterium]|nr:NlpC/P60 family protein [Rhodothermaceae bacterium]